MQFINATELNRNPGDLGHPSMCCLASRLIRMTHLWELRDAKTIAAEALLKWVFSIPPAERVPWLPSEMNFRGWSMN
jgi:hypothetical protein